MKKAILTTLLIIGGLAWKLSAQDTKIPIDIKQQPFSHYGAYSSLMIKKAPNDTKEGLYLQDNSGRFMWKWKGVFRIEPTFQGEVLAHDITATPEMVTIDTEKGKLFITYQSAEIIRFRAEGIGFKLTQTVKDRSSNGYPISADKQKWRCQMGGFDHFVFTALEGHVTGDAAKPVSGHELPDRPFLILDITPNEEGIAEAAIEQYQDGFEALSYAESFEQCVTQRIAQMKEFNDFLLPVPNELQSLSDKALFTKWSSVVKPKGSVKRYGMYCSKNRMNAIWPWDNCFDAMSTSFNNIDAALDYILVPFDHQTKEGGLPDMVTDYYVMRGAFKPPIQGLTLTKIMEYNKTEYTVEQLNKLYQPLVDYTKFWFKYMDDNDNGIPQYNHANDAGEDNCAVFDAGYPMESPDLCTYLIIQMDFLAYAAERLKLEDDVTYWNDKSAALLKFMIEDLWVENRFVAKNSFTRQYNERANSFLNFTPILLGDRLPKDIKDEMIRQLKAPNSIVTPYGPASEHPDSPYFIEDGYWRGAVWAPQYYFLVEGLNQCGEKKWAKKLAANYAEMCKKSGFPENFSALSGRPLRDSGYAWTSAVFLMLSHEYLVEN